MSEPNKHVQFLKAILASTLTPGLSLGFQECIEEIERLQRELDDIMRVIIAYATAGSPPPGGHVEYTRWVLAEMARDATEGRESE